MTLTKEALSGGLSTEVFGRKLFVFETIDSTNACAKTLAEAGMEEGAVVFAEYQSSGRGRQERTWESAAGENLLFTVILRPKISKDQIGFLTFFAATAVARAVEQTCAAQVECKWPNDLLIAGKKFCGILLENSLDEQGLSYSVVGIGINVNQKDFADGLRAKATSLTRAAQKRIDRVQLFQNVMMNFELLHKDVSRSNFDGVLADWNSRCSMFGKPVDIQEPSATIHGTAVGLHSDGGLIVQTGTTRRVFYAGDVTLSPH